MTLPGSAGYPALPSLCMLSLFLTRVFSPRGLRWALPGVIAGLIAAGLSFAAVEGSGVSAWDGVWWAFTTVSTVGYGDVVPRTDVGRLIGLAVMVLGVGFLFLLAGALVERFIAVEMRQELREIEAPEREILRRLEAMEPASPTWTPDSPDWTRTVRKEPASGPTGCRARSTQISAPPGRAHAAVALRSAGSVATPRPSPPPAAYASAAIGLSEGQRWSRNALDRLRERRFGAGAWVEFLGVSFRRARAVRGRRPDLARQSRRWGATGLAAALALGPRVTVWWVGWWAMVDWHLGMVETADGRPRGLAAADALTLGRLWAAPVVRRHPTPALALLAAASDLLDGRVARSVGPTRLGRELDWAADAAFFAGLLRGAAHRHGLSTTPLAAERARLVLGAALGVARYFGHSVRPAVPEERALPAVVATLGGFAAVTDHPRLAAPLLAAAVGRRTHLMLQAGLSDGRAREATAPRPVPRC